MSKQKPLILAVCFLIFTLIVGCGGGGGSDPVGTPASPQGTIIQTKCGPFDRIAQGDFVMENNVYGRCNSSDADCISDYSQCIDVRQDSSPIFEWTWNWPTWPDTRVKGSPEVIYGWKPWDAQSTTSRLPKALADISSLTASFDISSSATGIYNLSFDIWLNSGPIPAPNNRTREIMIWLDGSHWNRDLSKGTAKVSIGGDEYYFEQYTKTRDGVTWTYLGFYKLVPLYKGSMNILDFVNYLLGRGYLAPSEYLATVELMNEIKEGSGKTSVRDYIVTVN